VALELFRQNTALLKKQGKDVKDFIN